VSVIIRERLWFAGFFRMMRDQESCGLVDFDRFVF